MAQPSKTATPLTTARLQAKFKNVDLSNQSPQTGSPLVKLPPELRNRIAEMVLHGAIVRYHIRPESSILDFVKPRAPGLILACKQTYVEFIQVYYASTRIIFHNNILEPFWTRTVAEEHRILSSGLFVQRHGDLWRLEYDTGCLVPRLTLVDDDEPDDADEHDDLLLLWE